MIIDCSGKSGFTEEKVRQFASAVSNDETINITLNDSIIFKVTKSNLVKEFMSNPDFTFKDDDKLSFMTADCTLLFSGQTFTWWTHTKQRLNKFESYLNNVDSAAKPKKVKKEKVEIKENIYPIGVATLVDNELTNIHYFEGTKNECIEFINNDMFKRYIDETLNAKVVINLAFDIDEFKKVFAENVSNETKSQYKRNIEMWYTLQELENMGVITTK